MDKLEGKLSSYHPPLIVIAKSARMLVESAQSGGLEVIALDQFGDMDTRAAARQFCLIDDWSSEAVIADIEALDLQQQPVVIYGTGVDNNPELLEQLQQRYQLLGNSAQTVARVRDPRLFFSLLDDLEIAYPLTRFDSPAGDDFLQKRSDLEGGLGVRPVRFANENIVDGGCYFQQQQDGVPFSVLFLANGSISRIVGYNMHWVVANHPWQPYLFQGLANRYALSDKLQELIETWVSSIVAETGLQGLNNMDCLNVDGNIVVLEINPRPSASVALYDLDYTHGLLAEHIKCFNSDKWNNPLPQSQFRGSWVVYASADLRIGKKLDWPLWVSDRPEIHNEFNDGDPVCTLQASAVSVAQLKLQLMQRCTEISDLLLDSSASSVC